MYRRWERGPEEGGNPWLTLCSQRGTRPFSVTRLCRCTDAQQKELTNPPWGHVKLVGGKQLICVPVEEKQAEMGHQQAGLLKDKG